jgi:hypothetical protein
MTSSEQFRPPVGEISGNVAPLPADQVEFLDRLKMIDGRHIRPLPNLADHLNHEGLIWDESDLALRVNVNFSEETLAPFTEVNDHPNAVTFQPRRLARMGKEKSFRGAFFGVMSLKSEEGRRQDVPVVVKQYPIGGPDDAVHNAMQEVTMLEYVKKLGLPTVDVVGVIRNGYPRNGMPLMYVITRQRQGLESMDELSWRNLTTVELPDRLHPVLDTLESLHANLLFSGDPKFKNIGLGEDGGPIIYDLEHARSMRDLVEHMTPENEAEVLERIARLMSRDFSHVLVSVEDMIYPNLPDVEQPVSPMERFTFELNHILEPYHRRIMEGTSAYKGILNLAYNKALQQRLDIAREQQAIYKSRPT